MKTTLKVINIFLLLFSVVCIILCLSTLYGSEIAEYTDKLYEAGDEIDDINETIEEFEAQYGKYAKDEINQLKDIREIHYNMIDLCLEKIDECNARSKLYGVLSAVLFIAFIILVIVYKKKFPKEKTKAQ